MGLFGKHRGEKRQEPQTDSGCSWDELDAQGKGEEFDVSHAQPREYAERNFSDGSGKNRSGRHRK